MIHVCKGCGRKKEMPVSQAIRRDLCLKCYRKTSKFRGFNTINKTPGGKNEK